MTALILALLPIILGAGGGIAIGAVEPLVAIASPTVIKALPTVLKAAEYGLSHLPLNERSLTREEIERVRYAHAMDRREWFH